MIEKLQHKMQEFLGLRRCSARIIKALLTNFIFSTTSSSSLPPPPLHHHQASLPDHCEEPSPVSGKSCQSDLSMLALPEALAIGTLLDRGLLSFSLFKTLFDMAIIK